LIRRAIAPKRKQKLHTEYRAFLANRTNIDINTADSEQLILPGLWSFFFLWYGFTTAEKLTAEGDVVFTTSVCKKPEVSDAHISMGQDMKKEPSDELISLESHGLLFITIGIVPPTEGDVAVLDVEDTVIADSDPVGISAQVLKDTLGAIKRRLAIDNPFFMVEPSSEYLKGSVVFQMRYAAGEYKITRFKTVFEIVQELASEQCGYNPYRDEKPFSARHPAGFVRR
jgi:hypothetical protein